MAYFKKRGRPNLGLRIEEGLAYVTEAVYRSQGGKCEAKTFMPHVISDEDNEATLDDIMGLVKGAAETNRYLGRRVAKNGN